MSQDHNAVGTNYHYLLQELYKTAAPEESNNRMIIHSSHLVELAEPDAYDPRYKKWSKEDLPILPAEWKYKVSSGTRKQFDILKQLMNRKDVTEIICATDAGREGELIFRLVYHQCGCKKPFLRLWISSMEDSAIRDGFASLKPESEYDRFKKNAERYDNIRILKTKLENAIFEKLAETYIMA